MKVIVAALIYCLFFIVIEVIATKLKLKKEISRKTVHILSGISVAFLPLFMSFQDIVYLSLLYIPVMIISKKANILSSIHEVKRQTYGEVFFPVAIVITALVFPDRLIYMYGVLMMAISDGLASIIGQKYGKQKYEFLSNEKSYIGSLSFFASAVLIGLIIMTVFGIALGPTIALSILIAAILTFVEGVLFLGLDNLLLSPIASSLLLISLKLLGFR